MFCSRGVALEWFDGWAGQSNVRMRRASGKKDAWRADGMRLRDFAEFEAALVRYEAALRRRVKARQGD